MEKNELEAVSKEILALEGVIGLVFYNRNGEIIFFKSNIEPEHWIVPTTRDEIERKTLTLGEMICEIASGMSDFGKLEAVAVLHEKRNSFLIPLHNELYLGITAKKTVKVSLIEKVKKIIQLGLRHYASTEPLFKEFT